MPQAVRPLFRGHQRQRRLPCLGRCREHHLVRASGFAKRGFCGTCGSILFWKPNDEARYAILAGAFDHPECLHPGHHICTEARPEFYQINDGLPQYLGDGPGVTTAAG